ncbi:MAG: 3-dehydroquinate synthase [Candidatus Omnitrophota bacterium]|nr:3-dehydroquinate synthase [Candidatus Omnitrophota bacterium]
MTNSVKVPLKDRSYNILIGPGVIRQTGAILKNLSIGKDAIVVTNKKVACLYGKKIESSLNKSGISFKLELVPDSEKAKSHKTLISLLNRIGAYDKNRTLFLIALGGGVIGDLTGFAASIYKRGIPYVQIPTTLLSQVDSAIGGKTAIDLPAAKNLVGSFYQPKVVISDTSILTSLSGKQIKNGLAECIKYGVIKDKGLFEYLEYNYRKVLMLNKDALMRIVAACSRIKAKVVAQDELDRLGKRIILNYGHTVGHALESAADYSQRYNHGEAIAIGMVCASDISAKLNLIKYEDKLRIESLIKKCGLPVKISGLKISRIYDSLLRDKKFVHGKNKFVLPSGIGKVRIVEGIKRPLIINSIKGRM